MSPATLGIAISTIGRPELARLLGSAAESTMPPAVVAIANQSGAPLPALPGSYPFDLRVVPSTGGASAGRNAAVDALGDDVQLIAFPNDDSWYEPTFLCDLAEAFVAAGRPDALACTMLESRVPRFVLPPDGTVLGARTVWRAIEAATFVRADTLRSIGDFRTDLGTGCPTPWQSGEITELLLRIMAAGGRVVSLPSLHVNGVGERRDLPDSEFVAKHRRYARGMGYVYRTYPYPRWVRVGIVLMPWLRALQSGQASRLTVRVAAARSLGRLEGLSGRTLRTRTSRLALRP